MRSRRRKSIVAMRMFVVPIVIVIFSGLDGGSILFQGLVETV